MVDTRGRVAGSEREGRKEGWEGRRGAVCVSTSYVCITKRDSIRLDQQPSPAPASPSTYPRNYVIFSKRLQLPPPSIRFLPCKYKYIPQAAPGNTYLSSRLVSSRLRPTRFPSSPPRRHSSPRPAQRVARPGPPAWFKCCCFGHVRARVRVRRNGRALAYAGFLRSPTRAASARATATATARARAVRGVERENAPATCRLGGVEERTRERVSGGMGWDGVVGV